MAPIEIARQVSIYVVICGTLICVGCYIYRSCHRHQQLVNPETTAVRISFNRMNRELIEQELRIVRQNVNITNNQQITNINYTVDDKVNTDDIIVVIDPNGDIQLGMKLKIKN